jgi:hypothetical protein
MTGLMRMMLLSSQRTFVDCLGAVNFISPVLALIFPFSSVFNDFGSKFTCVDPTGEQPVSGMIVSVENVPSYYCSYERR